MERHLEHRNYDRIPFNAPVFLNKNGKRLFGEIENISQTGMYVSVTGNHAPGEYAEVSILLLRGFATLTLTLPGRIVRQGHGGIGFKSEYVDPSNLLCYASLLNLYRKDSPKLMEDVLGYSSNLIC